MGSILGVTIILCLNFRSESNYSKTLRDEFKFEINTKDILEVGLIFQRYLSNTISISAISVLITLLIQLDIDQKTHFLIWMKGGTELIIFILCCFKAPSETLMIAIVKSLVFIILGTIIIFIFDEKTQLTTGLFSYQYIKFILFSEIFQAPAVLLMMIQKKMVQGSSKKERLTGDD